VPIILTERKEHHRLGGWLQASHNWCKFLRFHVIFIGLLDAVQDCGWHFAKAQISTIEGDSVGNVSAALSIVAGIATE